LLHQHGELLVEIKGLTPLIFRLQSR
jgi:hypothetical protein